MKWLAGVVAIVLPVSLGVLALGGASEASPPAAGDVVVLSFDGTVWSVDPTTGAKQQVAAAGGHTDGGYAIAREASGSFVVATRQDGANQGRVARVAQNGTKTVIDKGHLGYFSLSAAVHPSTGEIFVGDESSGSCPGSSAVGVGGTLWAFTATSGAARCLDNASSETAGGLTTSTVMGMAFAPGGDLYVASAYTGDDQRGGIITVDPTTGRQALVTDNARSTAAGGAALFYDLRGLTRSADGTLFVVDDRAINGNPSCGSCSGADTRVVGVDPVTGKQRLVSDNERSAAAGGARLFTQPYGITVGTDGTLYVADQADGQLIAVDPSTGKQRLVASGLGMSVSLTFVPGGVVPTPTPTTSPTTTPTTTPTPTPTPALTPRRPAVTGRALVGSTLTMSRQAVPPGYSALYRWLRGTKAIAGATTTSYRLTKRDRGKQVTAAVFWVSPDSEVTYAVSTPRKVG